MQLPKTQTLIFFGITLVIIGTAIFYYIKSQGINYDNEIAKQELIVKCEDLYDRKHTTVEKQRYGEEFEKADALIWSSKTKSCLAYYNVAKTNNEYLFEVWDYSNTDLVLSYHSVPDNQCTRNGSIFGIDSLLYKLNGQLEANGCFLDLQSKKIDLLTNFETAMQELGFKK